MKVYFCRIEMGVHVCDYNTKSYLFLGINSCNKIFNSDFVKLHWSIQFGFV